MSIIDTLKEKFKVRKKLRDKRFVICLKCEDLNALNQCKHCHCFVHLKTWFKDEECAKPNADEKKW